MLQLFSCNRLISQIPPFEIPDSMCVTSELLILFRNGSLNYHLLGCNGVGFRTNGNNENLSYLPLDTTFIYSSAIVNYLTNYGAQEVLSAIPDLDPCKETISITKYGDTFYMPHFWNLLKMKYSQDQNILSIAYLLTILYYYPVCNIFKYLQNLICKHKSL